MNILILSSFWPEYGGNFIAQLNAIRKADAKNNYVYIFPTLAKDNEWCQEIEKTNKVYFIDPLAYIKTIKQIKKICKEEKVNLMHTHFGAYDNYAGIVSKILHIKIIVHVRSSKGMPKGFKKLRRKVKNRLLFNKAKFIAVNSTLEQEYFCYGIKKQNFLTIYDGVTFDRLNNVVDRENIAKMFNLDWHATNIMVMGYNIHIKGIDIALDGIDLARKKNTKLNLMIVVAAHNDEMNVYLKERYNDQIPNYIKILPPNQNIAEYYALADCVLSSSRTEGLSNVAIEALYLNKRLIVSNIPGTKWALDFKGVSEFDLNDINKLAELLLLSNEAYDNKEQLIQMFSMETFVNKLLLCYSN